MGKSVADLFSEATELDENDRAQLAGLLLESIDGERDPDVEAAWAQEIERRLASVKDGTATLIAWEDVKRDAHAKLVKRLG